MESQGSPYSASVSDKNVQSPVENCEAKDESVPDPEQMAKDASSLSEIMMPRKQRKLYEAMQVIPDPEQVASVSLYFWNFFQLLLFRHD